MRKIVLTITDSIIAFIAALFPGLLACLIITLLRQSVGMPF